MNKELVNYYFNKIVYYSKKNHYYYVVFDKKEEILKLLNDIVNKNMNYILTESLIDYICSYSIITTNLYSICNKYDCYDLLTSYFECITKRKEKIENDDLSYLKLLDEDTKLATTKAFTFIDSLYKNYNRYHYRLYDIERIVYIVLAYCLLNNKMNEYESICNIFIENPYSTLEDLYMNDIRDSIGVPLVNNDNSLVDRVINRIESKKKRSIK